MTTTLKDKMKKLPAARRKMVEARAAELTAQEMTLRELRQAHRRTQGTLPKPPAASDRKSVPPRKAQRPLDFNTAQLHRSHGRQPVDHRKIPRSSAC